MAVVRGESGVVKAGPQIAATLGKWSVEVTPSEDDTVSVWMTASVLSRHAVYSRCRPLDVVLSVFRREWMWSGVDVDCSGATVSLRAGPPRIR